MAHDSTGQAGAHQSGEIEITKKMISAGCVALWSEIGDGLFQSGVPDDLAPVVSAVLKAALIGTA